MIKDDIQNLVYKALKEHDKIRVDVLRFLLSQIKYKEIDLRKNITDEETVILLRQEIKKRRESIDLFRKGNREDLVKSNEGEIKVIEEFLPPSLPDIEINKLIDDILKKSEGPVHPGKLIGQIIGLTKGKADGSKIAELVNKKINKK